MGRTPYSYRKTVEESLSLSTMYLNQQRLLNGGYKNIIMTWSIGGNKTSSIGMIVSMLEGDEHCRFYYLMTDRFSGHETKLDYKIRLVSTPCYYGGNRWWFICPLVVSGEVCGRRVGVLYLGEGGEYFGCRHCYDLTYLCQKESGKYDHLYRQCGFDPKEARKALKYGSN